MPDIVAVKVRCFNRQSQEMFDRWYFADLSELQPNERQVVRELTTRTPPVSQFIAVRTLMKVCHQDDIPTTPIGTSFACVTIPDYFEDEHGQPMTPVDLISAMTGNQEPILLNDERSILRLGPQGLRAAEQTDTKAANTLAHFLQLVEVIATSRWVKTETKLGANGSAGAADPLTDFQCPTLSDTYSILLPLRQLFFEDGKSAFFLACKAYERYTADERKRDWITSLRKQCQAYMDSEPWPRLIRDCSVTQLLQALMYGGGMVHYHKTEPPHISRFRDLVQKHRREWVVFSFVVASQHLYAFARKTYHVIRQDYDHWRSRGWCPEPDIMVMSKLFESRPVP